MIGFINVLGGSARNRRRTLWAIGSIAGVILFTYAVGAGASVVRAAIMGCGGLIAPLVGRKADPLVWLGIASAAMAVQHPAVVGDLSFLLSCAATFGVLIVAPALARYAERFTLPSAFPQWTELIAVAVGAQLMTEPLIAHAYGRISLISPLVNLVVEPLVPGIMALGFVTALLSFLPFSLPAAALGICTTLPAWLFLQIIGAASAIPGAGLYLPHTGTRETVALYALPVIAAVAVHTVPIIRREIEREHRRPDGFLYATCFTATLTVAIVVVEWFR